jgi:hypothetical protein
MIKLKIKIYLPLTHYAPGVYNKSEAKIRYILFVYREGIKRGEGLADGKYFESHQTIWRFNSGRSSQLPG